MKKIYFFVLVVLFNCQAILGLSDQKGIYYLPEGLTDIRSSKFIDNSIFLLTKSEKKNVFLLNYEMGKSFLKGICEFKAEPPTNLLNSKLTNEKGRYYLPEGLTNVKDFIVLENEMILIATSEKKDIFMLFYDIDKSELKKYVQFKIIAADKFFEKKVKNENGKYYLPEGLNDVRSVILKENNIFFTGVSEKKTVFTIAYKMGTSLPEFYLEFKSVKSKELFEGKYSNQKGIYYLPEGLTDIRDFKITDNQILITSKAELGEVFILVYDFAVSSPESIVEFQTIDLNDILSNKLSDKKGVYYLPEGLTDLKNVFFDNSNMIVTAKAEKGGIYLVNYEYGKSKIKSIAEFKPVKPDLCFK